MPRAAAVPRAVVAAVPWPALPVLARSGTPRQHGRMIDGHCARVKWVVFDLGETLADETENWGRWADYLGVPRLTFFGTLGAVIADRRPHREVFDFFRPGFDLEAEIPQKAAAGYPWSFTYADLYDDALPALDALGAAGFRLAVMANQAASVAPFLETLPVERTATSDEWGVSKPDPAFFARMAHELCARPAEIAYVGDRVDNDVVPALQAGMVSVHLRRGPWGIIQSKWPEAAGADLRLDSLAALVNGLGALRH